MRLPMLASLCTVPFLFVKATEAQGNWFGGRPTVASPPVKKHTLGVTDHRGRIHRIGIQILDTPNGAVGRGKGQRLGGASLLRLLMDGRRRCGRRIATSTAVAEASRRPSSLQNLQLRCGHDGRIGRLAFCYVSQQPMRLTNTVQHNTTRPLDACVRGREFRACRPTTVGSRPEGRGCHG